VHGTSVKICACIHTHVGDMCFDNSKVQYVIVKALWRVCMKNTEQGGVSRG